MYLDPIAIRKAIPAASITLYEFYRSPDRWAAATGHTRAATLEELQEFLDLPSIHDACAALIADGPEQAQAIADAYILQLGEHVCLGRTTSRRLAHLHGFVRQARRLGFLSWTLQPPTRDKPCRRVAEPSPQGVAAALDHLRRAASPQDLRDRALLRLLWDLALRPGQVIALNLDHVDLETPSLAVPVSRGHFSRLTLPSATAGALGDWVATRGLLPGPLLPNFSRASLFDGRLSIYGVARIVHRLAPHLGVVTTPGGIRSTAILQAYLLTNWDEAAVERFSRHCDHDGQIARLVAQAHANGA